MPPVTPPGLNIEQRMTFIDPQGLLADRIVNQVIKRATGAAAEIRGGAIVGGGKGVVSGTLPKTGLIFSLRINPTKQRGTLKKVRKDVLTHAGWDVQTWRNEPWNFTYTGSSGVFRPDEQVFVTPEQADPNKAESLRSNEPFDIRVTKAWQQFTAFQLFYERTKDQFITILFRGETLIGYLDDFSFDEDANDPFQITYSISATIYSREFAQIELKSKDPEVSVLDRFKRAFRLDFGRSGTTDNAVSDDTQSL